MRTQNNQNSRDAEESGPESKQLPEFSDCAWRQWLPAELVVVPPMKLELKPDVPDNVATMHESMAQLLRKVDICFGQEACSILEDKGRQRLATALIFLLFERPADDGRNEVLHTKVFALVMSGIYRSHADALFQYNSGAWEQTDCISGVYFIPSRSLAP